MRHVEKALQKLVESGNKSTNFINIENSEDKKGIAPIVKFEIQSDPIGEVGVNGCQALDMLEYTKCLFQSLNDVFPCRENALTITQDGVDLGFEDRILFGSFLGAGAAQYLIDTLIKEGTKNIHMIVVPH